MSKQLEKPFEYLLIKKDPKKKGKRYDNIIVNDWYRARAYVLERIKDIYISPNENKHLHVVIEGDTPLMLSIARQVAMSAHFVNYDEASKKNRTIVTIVSNNVNTVIGELKKEEYLCNLLDYCKYSVNGNVENENSYIDIEFVIAQERPAIDEKTEIEMYVCEKDVISFCNSKDEEEIFCIDTSKAQYAYRMYCLGTEIDNLPYDDIHSVERYSLALDVFLYTKMEKQLGKVVDDEKWKLEDNQIDVLMALSNVFCADCFLTRYNSIKLCWANGKMTEKQAWEKHYLALSKSEHVRWVVEKLILGYKPLNNCQRFEDEENVKNKEAKIQFRKKIKSNWEEPTHIDLCSYSELRRVDPDSMKYDSFLMLGIPEILRKVGEI